MSQDRWEALIDVGEDAPPARPPSAHDRALLEEMSFVRREAQLEADIAYADWHEHPSADGYAVYRAAQDRADAAQDDLAELTLLLAA